MLRFHWTPNFPVLMFQDVEIVFCLLLVWFGRNHYEQFRRSVRSGIYWSLLPVAIYGLHDFAIHAWQWSFGMDDRSHTAVLFACEAYILIRLYGGKLDCMIACLLLGLTVMTVSRESLAFVPAIFIALFTRSRYGAALATVLIAAAIAAFVVAGDALRDTFILVNRLSSFEAATGGSTQAHVLLIQSGLAMKLSDIWCFLLGVGPGNYSNALTTFQIMLPEIRSYDPGIADGAQIGRAPMHSAPASLFLDMNILLFLLCLYFLARAIGYLIRTRSFLDLLFVMGLLGASTFYSVHNKPYIYLVVATLFVMIPVAREREREIEGARRLSARLALPPGYA
jgi:hypothetical protein